MRALQSLWTAPFSENGCGYNNANDLLMCTELSARLVKKSGDDLVFYTDKKGYEIIKPIRHIFDDVVICLDELKGIENFNWGFSKIHVYSLQNEPFYHLDNDVFIWNGLPESFRDSERTDYFFQGRELIAYHPFYVDALNELPKSFYINIIKKTPDYAVNCGVAGFNELNQIGKYLENSLEFINKNQRYNFQDSVHKYHQCILFEQLFLVPLIEKSRIEYILDDEVKVTNVPYTHLIANSKRNEELLRKVREKLIKIKKLNPNP